MCSSCSSVSGAISSVLQAKQNQVSTQIGVAVIAKGLEATQVQGEAAVALLEAAGEIAQQLGKGLQFDAQA
ncbi:MAG: hypothetical protein JNK76_16310 [Planctomycetales bacterium]|nr:hypothetical protein [Planctomycetales bacterium]MBN8626360.1 hypothetical protein [Planctomycetota bacterium]